MLKHGVAVLAEGMGLEPTGLSHLTPFPGELLSHSVNPPDYVFAAYSQQIIIYHMEEGISRCFSGLSLQSFSDVFGSILRN